MSEITEFERLMQIVRRLRAKDGCPWDREQTHESLKWDMLEETYEAAEAIDTKDKANLCEELGDMLMIIGLQTVIAEENAEFSMEDVVKGIADKMIYRHPHVFNREEDGGVSSTEEVLEKWEKLKRAEKHEESVGESMKRVAKALPATTRAAKVQKKASKVGMDFESYEQALEKVYEEIEEVNEARKNSDSAKIDEEFGDLMFSVVNLSRFLGINAELSLTNATNKFINRFVSVEHMAFESGMSLAQMTPEELDVFWRSAKQV